MNKLGITMRIILGAEILNCEGNVGNVMQPRQIEWIDGTIRQAVSGDMLKHDHTRNLRLLSKPNELCDGCKIFKPEKESNPKEEDVRFSKNGNKVKNCIIDDIEGFMDTKAKTKRSSCVKFSWAVATEENEPQILVHNRVDNTDVQKNLEADKNKEGDEDNTEVESSKNSQMIFYKPIRSNIYALTVQVDLDRIGFDDEKLIYCLSDEEIKERQRKCLKAITNMFVDIEGANCSTALPHIIGVQGIVTRKTDVEEVLTKYSAINDDFIEETKRLNNNYKVFNTVGEFAEIMSEITK